MPPENRIPAHPGAILRREYMEPLDLSVDELARHLEVEPAALSQVVEEEARITPELAWRLSQAFDTTPELWLQLQAQRDLAEHKPARAVPRLVTG